MEQSIFDEYELARQTTGDKLLESYRFWKRRRRFIFNITVGVTGAIAVVLYSGLRVNLFDIIGIIAWGAVANILYSSGYMLESFVIVKSGGKRNIKGSRVLLFWVGTICYCVVSFVFCQSYFTPFIA